MFQFPVSVMILVMVVLGGWARSGRRPAALIISALQSVILRS
jgi:hypothetical protein